MTKPKQNGHEIKVCGFGPADFTGKLVPGFNVLTAANGSGKTRVLTALAWALGCDVPADLRHVADRGYVEIDGTRIRTLEKRIPKIGDLELALGGANPIADVVMPDVSDPKRGEVRRIEALLKLVDVPVDDDAISVLADQDDNVIDYLSEVEPGLREASIVAVANTVRLRTHELKRRWESQADQEQGKIDGIRVQEPERVSEVPIDQAQRDYDAAVGDHRQLSGEASQRTKREAERAEIQATLGDRPDIAEYKAAFLEAEQDLARIRERKQDLGRQIAALQARLESEEEHEKGQIKEVASKAANVTKIAAAAEAWDRNKAILDSEITGATQVDVDAAILQVAERRAELDAARETARWKESSELALEAQKNRDSARKRAGHYEALATGVTARLAKLLEKAGLKSLTVDDGKLCYVHQGGKLEPFTSLSFGQRTRAIMPLLTKRELPYNILVLPRQFYDGLDGKAKEEVGRVFADAQISVCVEEPGESSKLEVAHI